MGDQGFGAMMTTKQRGGTHLNAPFSKMTGGVKTMRKMRGGSDGTGSANGYMSQLAGLPAQEQQLNSMSSTTAVDGPQATTIPFARSDLTMGHPTTVSGGSKSKKMRKTKGMKKKRGGSGLEMAVPLVLVAANQMYKPKGKTMSFRKSRKSRTMRRRK